MESIDLKNLIVLAEDLFLLVQNAKSLNFQGLEVQTDRKLQGAVTKSHELLTQLHLTQKSIHPEEYKVKDANVADKTGEKRSEHQPTGT